MTFNYNDIPMGNLKRLYLFMICALLNTPIFSKALLSVGNRQQIGFNDQWSFSKDEKNWERVSLPHTWNAKDVMDDEPGYYRGTGWYKRTLKTNAALKDKQVFLCFDGVNQETEIYVNGRLAGKHIGGYTGFRIPLTAFLKFDGSFTNEILVKVTNRFNEDIAPLTADFTFFGGIYRNVNLLITDKVHFSNQDHGSNGVYLSTPLVSNEKGVLKLKALMLNSSDRFRKLQLNTAIYDARGKQVSSLVSQLSIKAGEEKALTQYLPAVAHPDLWSPEHPNLYRVVTKIVDPKDQSVIDLLQYPLGFRWFKFDAAQGFFLNGKPLKLVGASRHQDYEGLGNAVPEALQIRDVTLIKEMGGNFLRVAHYPQDPVILETCDRLGILASVEIPLVNAITETDAFKRNCEQMQLEMIKQNFNHPSVVIWAYMNEILLRPKFVNDKERQALYFDHIRELAESLEILTRKEDASRYTMLACHGDFERYHKVGLTKIPMVLGWNLYQGWYGGNLDGFAQFLDKHHTELPEKPMLVTEFGADADPRIRSFSPVRFDKSVEYALKFNQVYLNAILSRPFVNGAMVWNLADFNSETREETMPHVNNKGLLTLSREPKDTYYLYQAYLLKEPFLKISSAHWKERTGMADSAAQVCTQLIQVATNLKAVELFLNGKSLGIKPATDHLCEWAVPFINGINKLRAVDPEHSGLMEKRELKFKLLPDHFSNENFNSLQILLGAKRYFIDEKEKQLWIPDQPYRKGAWGSVGGQPFKAANDRMSYGSDRNILETELDPIFQTQQVDLKQYKMDVPDGEYELTLYFAELLGGLEKEALAYNLDHKKMKEEKEQRVFSLKINEVLLLENFNISAEYGVTRAVEKKTRLNVTNGKGIRLDFIPVLGKPVLNALKLRKI